jgi:predicted Fe-Mo cluster-binding NifX family protein
MEICITATSDDLDCKVDGRFGRCKYFIFIDPDTMKYRAMPNPALEESGGAGIKAATTVLKYAPAAVITGMIGDNALNVLKASGVKAYSCGNVSVREAVEIYSAGKLESIDAPNNG